MGATGNFTICRFNLKNSLPYSPTGQWYLVNCAIHLYPAYAGAYSDDYRFFCYGNNTYGLWLINGMGEGYSTQVQIYNSYFTIHLPSDYVESLDYITDLASNLVVSSVDIGPY